MMRSGSRRPIDLSHAGPGDFRRIRGRIVEAAWILTESIFISNRLMVSSGVRASLLRLFGANIGRGVIIRQCRVKFPWNLQVGDRAWIGEDVWIHNQGFVSIGSDAVISQGSFITTGSHEIQRTMDLVVAPVVVERGAWVTARVIVLGGSVIEENAIVTPGSVVRGRVKAGTVVGGVPARYIKERFEEDAQR